MERIDGARETILIISVFFMGMFFSGLSWLNNRVTKGDCERLRTFEKKVWFITHSFISGAISVTIFAWLYSETSYSVYIDGSLSVIGAVISDTVLERIRTEVKK